MCRGSFRNEDLLLFQHWFVCESVLTSAFRYWDPCVFQVLICFVWVVLVFLFHVKLLAARRILYEYEARLLYCFLWFVELFDFSYMRLGWWRECGAIYEFEMSWV